ncbi:Putative teichuronic acid biosynthesis glycosyltransferase TuaG [Anaerohalosphaera lusitana]|uniref:Putative teichuronic acid biosynthesis glycosyltransferase TuaG n=1 Tax=Anaerohalosphaera lusitana TaxID=1936003 RepID=A0A1U9NN90_9BACT|nr:glycosyltransferase [Anaerohalosphaera lusitana]AQT69267.1 Putative teichuronic acid biosynthesis glycosyltransferase TuaG [Anaerohalosphaera lusitana]
MTNPLSKPYLSIILPAYNEGRKVAVDVERASGFLDRENLTGEIIVVDDGSTDDTASVAKQASISSDIALNVKRYDQNRGKGYAIRTGVLNSAGRYVMFADCGCCVPYHHAKKGLDLISSDGCAIAHASRRDQQSDIQHDQPLQRKLFSKAFRWTIINFMGVPAHLTDTQCGFKVYRGDVARQLFSQCVVDGFMFDVEVILRAHRAGYKIGEFPIEWTCDRDSRLTVRRNALEILRELWQIRQALKSEQ